MYICTVYESKYPSDESFQSLLPYQAATVAILLPLYFHKEIFI